VDALRHSAAPEFALDAVTVGQCRRKWFRQRCFAGEIIALIGASRYGFIVC
jgi:hypothetical protein